MNDSSKYQVSEITDERLWTDLLLSFEYPHPMQTWQWGEASAGTGERVMRWSVEVDGKCVLLTQCFQKRVKWFPLKLAWVPRGPVYRDQKCVAGAVSELGRALRPKGFRILVAQPYSPTNQPEILRRLPLREREFTFVVDLQNLSDKVYRLLRNKGINRFEREGGVVVEHSGEDAIETLIRQYSHLAERKNFNQYGGERLIRNLWKNLRRSNNPLLSAHVFHAEIGSQTASSCLVLRINRTAHFLWAASEYELRNLGSGEALQWHMMQRLRAMGVAYYDLEGGDKKRNPGVYNFKAKLGGVLVERAPVGFRIC